MEHTLTLQGSLFEGCRVPVYTEKLWVKPTKSSRQMEEEWSEFSVIWLAL